MLYFLTLWSRENDISFHVNPQFAMSLLLRSQFGGVTLYMLYVGVISSITFQVNSVSDCNISVITQYFCQFVVKWSSCRWGRWWPHSLLEGVLFHIFTIVSWAGSYPVSVKIQLFLLHEPSNVNSTLANHNSKIMTLRWWNMCQLNVI